MFPTVIENACIRETAKGFLVHIVKVAFSRESSETVYSQLCLQN